MSNRSPTRCPKLVGGFHLPSSVCSPSGAKFHLPTVAEPPSVRRLSTFRPSPTRVLRHDLGRCRRRILSPIRGSGQRSRNLFFGPWLGGVGWGRRDSTGGGFLLVQRC